jgi:hypothetical protein
MADTYCGFIGERLKVLLLKAFGVLKIVTKDR